MSQLPVVLDARVVTGVGGGPEKTILNSPRFLRPLGYEMVCAYLHPPHDPGFDELKRRAEVQQAELVSLPDRGPLDWRVFRDALKLCRARRVAIWHGHDYKSNVLGILLKPFHPMRLVTTAHGWVRHTSRTPLYYAIDRWSLRWYQRIFAVSDDLYQDCLQMRLNPKRCILLENGIDTQQYTRTLTHAQAKEKLGFPPDAKLVGGVGRLSPEKGYDLLLQAVANLQDIGPVHLVLVGEGDERDRLHALAESLGLGKLCRFAGYQSDTRIYYEAMDVFALSSLREGLPNVVLEALALEVPVVATAIAGVPKLVRHEETGLLVPPGDVSELADGLRRMLSLPILQSETTQAGRLLVERQYSFAARMARLAAIYDSLLAGSSA